MSSVYSTLFRLLFLACSPALLPPFHLGHGQRCENWLRYNIAEERGVTDEDVLRESAQEHGLHSLVCPGVYGIHSSIVRFAVHLAIFLD